MYTQIDKQEKKRRGEDDNQKKNEPTSALVDSFRMTSSLPCTYLTGRTKTSDTVRTVW